MKSSCWICLSESLKMISIRSSKELFAEFFLKLKWYIIKSKNWNKLLWRDIKIRQKQPPQVFRRRCQKVIYFQKFPNIRNTSGRIFLLVKVQALLYKNDSTKGFFLENFRKFPEHLWTHTKSIPHILFYELHVS